MQNQNNLAAVAIFVKTAAFSHVKTRLAKSIGSSNANIIFKHLVNITIETISNAASKNGNLRFYWAVSEKEAINKEFWNDYPNLWQGEGCLGTRLYNIQNQLFKYHDKIMFIGADAPFIDPSIFTESFNLLLNNQLNDIVIGPSEDGGFYLYGANIPRSLSDWTSVEYSQHDTTTKLINRFCNNSKAILLHETFDIDTFDDLSKAYKFMQIHKKSLTVSQKALFDFMSQINLLHSVLRY